MEIAIIINGLVGTYEIHNTANGGNLVEAPFKLRSPDASGTVMGFSNKKNPVDQ